MSNKKSTVEQQYNALYDVAKKHGISEFGIMANQSWNEDPKRTLFTLSRYKFVSKMLSGLNSVLEIGCADAFGTRLVQQTVKNVTAIDISQKLLDSIENYKIGYKKKIDINSIEELSGITAGRKTSYEDRILDLENQMSMSSFLSISIKPGTYKTLPTNIGILNVNINSYIDNYNQLISERDKLLISAGKNNPTLKAINEKLAELQENILRFNKNKSIEKYSFYYRDLKKMLSHPFIESLIFSSDTSFTFLAGTPA